MANPEHLAILDSGDHEWNAWRAANPSIKPDLSGADLQKRSFYELNLTQTDLSAANLSESWCQSVRFVGASLKKADLTYSKLTHADLSGADLREADLSNAQCSASFAGADLRQSKLASADFWGANANRANFERAEAVQTEFHYADLTESRFKRTDFTWAKILRCDCTRTNFAGAYFRRTSFVESDLSTAIGLDKAEFLGPVSIDFDTLFQSHCNLDQRFLRLSGLTDDIIAYLPSLLASALNFHSCFISYSHRDKAFASLLHERLHTEGIRCWLDEHQLLPGDDLHEGIDRGIRLWDKVLLCCSKSSLTSWWVDSEINRAFQKEAQLMEERGKKVLALIPLNLDGYLFSEEYQSGKKSEINGRMAGNFAGWERDDVLFERELRKVVRALKTNDTGREKPPASKL